jgi:NAD(P)-dependent dehydrogenase (short-subunit alcohol dehydrogenase family)
LKILKDRVAIIMGAGSGIGRGCALAFARAGTNVVIADIREDRAKETAEAVRACGVDGIGLRCDVTSEGDIEAVRQAAIDRFGHIHILMNNVGVLPIGGFQDVPLSEWERTFQVNLLAYVRATQKILPDMLAEDEGHLVNTASLQGFLAYDRVSLAYAASKAAVVSLTGGLALDLRPRNVGVTCLSPGPVTTNIVEQIRGYGEDLNVGEYASRYFPAHSPDEVGEMLVAAVRENRFLVQTNSEAQDYVVRQAADPEGFLSELLDFFSHSQESA